MPEGEDLGRIGLEIKCTVRDDNDRKWPYTRKCREKAEFEIDYDFRSVQQLDASKLCAGHAAIFMEAFDLGEDIHDCAKLEPLFSNRPRDN